LRRHAGGQPRRPENADFPHLERIRGGGERRQSLGPVDGGAAARPAGFDREKGGDQQAFAPVEQPRMHAVMLRDG
jgi:hypothetical protein